MSYALVCGKWWLPLPGAPTAVEIETIEGANGKPYWEFLKRKTLDLSGNALCYEYVISGLTNVNSVVEYFGGLGISTLVTDGTLGPKKHTLVELDPICCEHLRVTFPQHKIIEGDAFPLFGKMEVDLAVADFNHLTIHTHFKNKKLLENAFNVSHIVIADSAPFKLHLNKESYTKLAGRKIDSWESYCGLWGEQFPGYGLRKVARHHNAGYLLFSKGFQGKTEYADFRRRRDGFVLKDSSPSGKINSVA